MVAWSRSERSSLDVVLEPESRPLSVVGLEMDEGMLSDTVRPDRCWSKPVKKCDIRRWCRCNSGQTSYKVITSVIRSNCKVSSEGL